MQRKNFLVSHNLQPVFSPPKSTHIQPSPRKPHPKLNFPFKENGTKLQHYRSLEKINPHTSKTTCQTMDCNLQADCPHVYIYLIYKNSKIQL
jgi:hypothetical protein